ncbi:Uncharacterised protein (plasmid) [Legionella adelaidensis]|uniref:Uncharacterized protein n=1 Tax=Legionella adelaidensis TaxID=45056 RepID=A0A0W0R1W3_9GAMM|nr:hypothetical protein [Legionella adelaidensis]KTC65021.1 hypothetical protein Lade_1544 [Legionella adelaidensis]VEH85460.1 Uncharacterised protein [Legionella adelaidensis]
MPREIDIQEWRVSPQELDRFLHENPIDNYLTRHSLGNVPADRWNRISTFVRANLRHISNAHIDILSKISMEILDPMLVFIRRHDILDYRVLYALSQVSADDWQAFTTFIQENNILRQSDLLYILVKMPKDEWQSFTNFVRSKNFDREGLKGGLLYAKQPEDRWEDLFSFIQRRLMSDWAIGALIKMSPDESFTFIKFLKENDVTDWDAINTLVNIPETQRARLWDFAKQHNLVRYLSSLAKISNAQWDAVTRFILENPLDPDKASSFSCMILSLSEVPPEEWLDFVSFIRSHQITDQDFISEFAQTAANRRENLFQYIQEYKPKPYQLNIKEITPDLWPQFIEIIKKYHITDPGMIDTLALKEVELWEELASFIGNRNITDYYVVNAFEDIPLVRIRALLAFIEQFNITDQHIIEGLARIPAVQQWEHLINISAPLLQPPLRSADRAQIMKTVYEITVRQSRIDREMPVYGEEERQGRIANALAEIQAGQMPQYPGEYYERLRQILTTPLNQLVNMHRAARLGATAIDVHATGRDEATTQAMGTFMQLAYDTKEIPSDYTAFIDYLNHFPNEFIKKCARMVLGFQAASGFAPITADAIISSHGINITGREFFARLWHFINHGPFIGMADEAALNKERENARVALITNLADAYEEEHIVCNPGKIQRIATGVLQGRLLGVHVDKEIPVGPSTSEATASVSLSPEKEESVLLNAVASSLRDFIKTFEPLSKTQEDLRSHVEEWLLKEQGLEGQQLETYRSRFKEDLEKYLAYSDLPENNPVSVPSSSKNVGTSQSADITDTTEKMSFLACTHAASASSSLSYVNSDNEKSCLVSVDEPSNPVAETFKECIQEQQQIETRNFTEDKEKIRLHQQRQYYFNAAVETLINGLECAFPAGNQANHVAFLKTQLEDIAHCKFTSIYISNPHEITSAVNTLFNTPQAQYIAKYKKWGEMFRNFAILIGYIATVGITAGVVKVATGRFFPETSVEKQIREFKANVNNAVNLSLEERNSFSGSLRITD